MNGGNWSGNTTEDATITYEAVLTASPSKTYTVEFDIKKGDKATHVAKALEEAWNIQHPDGPRAARVGATVEIAGTVDIIKVNDMTVQKNGAVMPVPRADRLHVHRDAP